MASYAHTFTHTHKGREEKGMRAGQPRFSGTRVSSRHTSPSIVVNAAVIRGSPTLLCCFGTQRRRRGREQGIGEWGGLLEGRRAGDSRKKQGGGRRVKRTEENAGSGESRQPEREGGGNEERNKKWRRRRRRWGVTEATRRQRVNKEGGGIVCVCVCVCWVENQEEKEKVKRDWWRSVCVCVWERERERERERRGVFDRAEIRWREHQRWCPIRCYFCSTLLSLASITAAAIIFTTVCLCVCVCKLIRSKKMRNGGKEKREEWSFSSSSADKIQATHTHTAPLGIVCVCACVFVCVQINQAANYLMCPFTACFSDFVFVCVCAFLQLSASCWTQSRNHMCV